jgi:hypothetical protein
MPTREFSIKATAGINITDVGLRARLYSIGYVYHVKVAPINVSKALVRIVFSGDEEAIDSFYHDAVSMCKDEFKIIASQISNPSEYKGLEPDWQSYSSMFTAEQTAKGVVYLQRTHQKLEDIEAKFGVIGATLGSVSTKLDSLITNLAPMNDINNNLKEMNKTLKQLTETLSKSS